VQCNQQLATAGGYISSGCRKVLGCVVAPSVSSRHWLGLQGMLYFSMLVAAARQQLP
jgi:hypothetical protein